jgi:hypothetical protein
MLSAVVTVLMLSVMLFVITSFIISALRQRRHYTRALSRQEQVPPYSTSHAMMVPGSLHKEVKMGVERPIHHSAFILPSSWYRKHRTLVSLGLLLMISLTLFVQSGLADGTLRNLKGFSAFILSHSSALDIQAIAHSSPVNASQQLVRISQLDPNQYSSSDEYNAWAYSACSAASMTEVFNAYGPHYRITDILKVEAQLGEITPALGLVRPEGIEHTAAQFGFKTTWGNAWTLDRVINTANQGMPVIVSFPPDRYDGGHILVVTGGDSSLVYLADSSLWNRHSLTRGQFLQWWEGFAAVVTPR